MATNKMFIPEKITVGHVERSGTYTGNLSFVIYTDNKGVLRQERSWDSWRDKKLGSMEFTNEPTSGFVLNKKAGGYSTGWNHRNTYVRIYDPRGFEFEIDIPNLVFILEECDSHKGKGLEGEFVYSWSGKNIVLLPVSSQEYTKCISFTEQQSGKVTKKEMVEGCTYLMKNMTEVMYLGRHEYYEWNRYVWNGLYTMSSKGKKHIFLNVKHIGKEVRESDHYIIQPGFTKLSQKTSEVALESYADEYEKLRKGPYVSPLADMEIFPKTINEDKFERYHWHNEKALVKDHDGFFYHVNVSNKYDYDLYDGGQPKKIFILNKATDPVSSQVKNGICEIPSRERSFDQGKYKHVSLDSIEFYGVNGICENGAKINIF